MAAPAIPPSSAGSVTPSSLLAMGVEFALNKAGIDMAVAAVKAGYPAPVWDGSANDFLAIQAAFDYCAANRLLLEIPAYTGTNETTPMKITGTINWQHYYHSVRVSRSAFIQWQQNDGTPMVYAKPVYDPVNDPTKWLEAINNTVWEGGHLMGRNDVASVVTVPFTAQPTAGDYLMIGQTQYQFVASGSGSTTRGGITITPVVIGASLAATLANLVTAAASNIFCTVTVSSNIITCGYKGSGRQFLSSVISSNFVNAKPSRGSCASVHGFDVGGQASDSNRANMSGARITFSGIAFEYVGDHFTMGANTYCVTWDGVHAMRGDRFIRCHDTSETNGSPANAGEKMTVNNCILTINRVLDCNNASYNFINSSLDYSWYYDIWAYGASDVRLTDCHHEYSSDNGYRLMAYNASIISYVQSRVYIAASGAKAWEHGWTYGGLGSGNAGINDAHPARILFDDASSVIVAAAATAMPRTLIAGRGFSRNLARGDLYGTSKALPVSRAQNLCMDGALTSTLATVLGNDWRALNTRIDTGLGFAAAAAGSLVPGTMTITPAAGETKTFILPAISTAGGWPYLDLLLSGTVTDAASLCRMSIILQAPQVNGLVTPANTLIGAVPSNTTVTNTLQGPSSVTTTLAAKALYTNAPVPPGTTGILFKLEFFSNNGTDTWTMSDIFADIIGGSPQRGIYKCSTTEFVPVLSGVGSAGAMSGSVLGTATLDRNIVDIDIYANFSAHTGTGQAQFTGLPYVLDTGRAYNFQITSKNIALPNPLRCTFSLVNGLTTVQLFTEQLSTGAYTYLPMPTSGLIWLKGRYACQ